MPPRPATTADGRFGKRLLTMPAALRDDRDYFIHLLDWQQSPAGPTVSGLAAAVPARWYH